MSVPPSPPWLFARVASFEHMPETSGSLGTSALLVCIHSGVWEASHELFDFLRHDDQIDSVSQFLNWAESHCTDLLGSRSQIRCVA
jgi:hypothetical protein